MVTAVRCPAGAAPSGPWRSAPATSRAAPSTQHQRASPRKAVPLGVRGNRIREDLHREGRDRLCDVGGPEAVVQRGEQERRGFAGDARQRQQDAGQDSRQRRRHHDREDGAASCCPECKGSFLQRRRDQAQELLGRSHDERNHHDAERQSAGQRREAAVWQHGDAVDEHADDNRRHTVERVGREPRR